MTTNKFNYTIGDKQYAQKPLVLGQIRQLTAAMADVSIDMSQGVLGIVSSLGDRLPSVLAAVLVPSGQNLRDRDLKEIAEDLEANCDLQTMIAVIEDFFTCNPTAFLLQKLAGAMKELAPVLTGLKISSASSPAETLPSATPSPGE